MQNKLKSTQLVHIIKKYIPEIIVFILLILSIIVYFKISNKDKSDISVPTDENGLYPQQTYDSSIIDTDEFYLCERIISKKDYLEKQVVNINEEVTFTTSWMNTFKHDVRDEYPSNTIQCPKLSLVINDAYITKSLNGESKSGYDYIILDITVKNCYDSQIMFDNSMQIQNYMGKDMLFSEEAWSSLSVEPSENYKIYINSPRKCVKQVLGIREYSPYQYDIIDPSEKNNRVINTDAGETIGYTNHILYTDPGETVHFRVVTIVQKSLTPNIDKGLIVASYSGQKLNSEYCVIIPKDNIKYEESITWEEDWWLN